MSRAPGVVMTRKLLVVDDDPAVRDWALQTLAEAGYTTLGCEDGQRALGLVRDERPDLVLMDVEMPGLGGREVCRIIKGSPSFGFLPVILMTTSADVQGKVEGLELGADDFLVKPLNPLELVARVKSMLRLKELQDELQQANERLKRMNEHLQTLSTTDPLMGISNRIFFEKRIAYEFQRAERYRKPLALLVLDLDHFKRINDTCGHPFGDEVLRAVAGLLVASIRQVDIAARYGGEELVVALPETGLDQAALVAERIRQAIERNEVADGERRVRVTVSIGAAVCPAAGVRSVADLLQVADAALYRAKHDGRNCVRLAPEGADPEPG